MNAGDELEEVVVVKATAPESKIDEPRTPVLGAEINHFSSGKKIVFILGTLKYFRGLGGRI